MIDISVSTAEGELLDALVARALGWKQKLWGDVAVWVQAGGEGRFRCNVKDWRPSADWAQGGPIMEEAKISTMPRINGTWYAEIPMEIKQDGVFQYGPTKLIAAMRCFVDSTFEHAE